MLALSNIVGKDLNLMEPVRARRIDLIGIHHVDPLTAQIHKEILAYVRTRKSERRIARTKWRRIVESATGNRAAVRGRPLVRVMDISEEWINKARHWRVDRTLICRPA